MADSVHQFGNISLSSRGGASHGILKMHHGGLSWKRSGGGKTVDIKREDIDKLVWTRVTKGAQLGVRRKTDATINLVGFRDKDLDALRSFCQENYSQNIEEQSMSLTGRNWGEVNILGNSMVFNVANKPAFEVPLPDVSQVDQQRDEVALELHLDDTMINDTEDALVGISFYIPGSNTDYAGEEENATNTAAQNFAASISGHIDTADGTTADACCIFQNVGILAPRGRFAVEMHLSFLNLSGQTNDYKIRYTSISRLFILPKPYGQQTVVVISLDPPIRKGQTYYPHILCQFDNKEEAKIDLDMSEKHMKEKNEQYKAGLTESMQGPTYEVFAKVLRGLSGAKMTKPNTFRAFDQTSYGIKCSYKADEGFLFPLERSFFYIHKPPLLLHYEEISAIEFERQQQDVVSASVKTFDFSVSMKNGTKHSFRGIHRTEYQGIFNFVQGKKLRIENFDSAKMEPRDWRGLDIGDVEDPGIINARIEVDTDSDDESFKGSEKGSDAGSDSEGDSGSDAELIAEADLGIMAEDIEGPRPGKKRPAESSGGASAAASAGGSVELKPASSDAKKPAKPAKKPKVAKQDAKDGGADDGKKKPRKKKDKNAPKNAMSAYMQFSVAIRPKIVEENPGIAFTEIGKLIAARWKELSAEDKKPYDELAAKDKERYKREKEVYDRTKAANGDAS